jgi:hypothetical protein
MKRLIAILTIMIVLAGAVFADSTTKNDELKVSIEITKVAPTFKLYGSLTEGTASTGMQAGEDVASAHSATAAASTIEFPSNALLEGSVTVYCVIKQTNDAKYTSAVNLSVAATSLTDGLSTSNPTISTPVAQGNVDGIRTTSGTAAGAATVTYTGKTAEIADIASFNVVYPKTDLIPGSYDGYITLTYTTTV